jgi:hypothetical protein
MPTGVAMIGASTSKPIVCKKDVCMLEQKPETNHAIPLPIDLQRGTLFDAAILEQLKGEQ